MKQLILKFLETNYTLNFEAYAYHTLYNKTAEKSQNIRSVIKDMNKVFVVDPAEFIEAFDEWVTKKSEDAKIAVIEIQERLQKITGRDVLINEIDLAELTVANQSLVEYIKGKIEYRWDDDDCVKKCDYGNAEAELGGDDLDGFGDEFVGPDGEIEPLEDVRITIRPYNDIDTEEEYID